MEGTQFKLHQQHHRDRKIDVIYAYPSTVYQSCSPAITSQNLHLHNAPCEYNSYINVTLN